MEPSTTLETKAIGYNRLRCEACNKKLVHLVANEPKVAAKPAVKAEIAPPAGKKYRADCPFCGDRSPSRAVTGSVCPIPEDGVQIIDVDMTDDTVLFRTSRV